MSDVFFDQKYTDLIKLLTEGEERIFATNKNLALFAGMVGFDSGQGWREARLEPGRKGASAPERVFENAREAGIPYLTAIAAEKTSSILKDASVSEAWAIFEAYVNIGMEIIQSWIYASPGVEPHEILMSKLLVKAGSDFNLMESPDDPDGIF